MSKIPILLKPFILSMTKNVILIVVKITSNRVKMKNEDEDLVLSSVIFNSFIKGNNSKLKHSISKLVMKAEHTARKMI